MQIHKRSRTGARTFLSAATSDRQRALKIRRSISHTDVAADKNVRAPVLVLALLLSLPALTACHKDLAREASDSDANGYLCLNCGAKLYTDRSVFIGPKCPQCQQDSLMEAVGYVCSRDNSLTIQARSRDQRATPVCSQCQAPVSALRLPREKDLKTWGAKKVSS